MLPLTRIWIWVSVLATLSGWILSASGQLNRIGYAILLGVEIAVLWYVRGQLGPIIPRPRVRKILRRFRRPLPLSFAALAALVFLGGVIHVPDNYTGLAYRVARVLQWLSHDHWLWVHTENYRMNDRACGFEWLAAPVLCFTHSLRPLFLVNFLPFLLLPGLIFALLIRLGVRRRVAWQWMWLLPTGYNFLLQAGSIANDTFPTVYALAAVVFALRARESGNTSDAWHSILAAALLVGAKASNLPLLLPWVVAIFPALPWLRRRVIATASVLVISLAVSFVPTAILNIHYCGDWSGAKLEPSVMTVANPLVAFIGNVFQLLLDNLWPPFCPFANAWNQHAPQVVPHFLASISGRFNNGIFHVGELPTEDWAGLGLGLSVLLAVSVAAKFFAHRPGKCSIFRPSLSALAIFPWLALLIYCAHSGMDTAARLIAPYYPLLLPALLAWAGPERILRSRWWHVLVGSHLVVAAMVVVLTPDRPLWPARTMLANLAERHPSSGLLARAQDVYVVYAKRADSLADVRDLLPPDAKRIGFAGGADDCDLSLWLPLGSRQVEHILLSDPPETIRAQHFDCVVLGGDNLRYRGVTLGDWLKPMNAEVIGTTNVTLKVSEGPRSWYVVRLK